MVWEERWHPLREEWVVVAAHRQDRPWIGQTVRPKAAALPDYLPDCYLCPGNLRVSGQRNPPYRQTFVFDNDHPCVGPESPIQLEAPPGIFRNRPAQGLARVLCYSPKHNLALAQLDPLQIQALIQEWQAQFRDLSARAGIRHVLIFENKGDVVGVSNPHPHGQIYATNFVFKTIETEAAACAAHRRATGRILFQDILAAETSDGRRILAENGSAIAFVPYFARYAYETFAAPKETHPDVSCLSAHETADLASILHSILVRFDNLWQCPFPYVMALHQAPLGGPGEERAGFHFHIEFHPPLRKPGLLKYLAGPEIGGGCFLSDTSPEEKAAELRALPGLHYTKAETAS